MIISPPFLPEPGALDEAAWLDVAMAPPIALDRETLAPEGSYPLSRGLAWHNGVHLQAPRASPGSGATHLSVRAIADGRVVYAHAPTPSNDSPDHPLNHNAFDAAGGPTWTSDGFVVIAHTTEIGAASGPGPTPASTPTQVTFYSVCMHLASLALNPRT
jgi:hypothetical protein